MFNLFKDKDGDVSSRITFSFIIIIFDLLVIILSLLLQKDIPENASSILITLNGACLPTSIITQYLQNVKEREMQENRDIDGDGKIGE
jgi:hypothetical protein